jgi:hypothetical protein
MELDTFQYLGGRWEDDKKSSCLSPGTNLQTQKNRLQAGKGSGHLA